MHVLLYGGRFYLQFKQVYLCERIKVEETLRLAYTDLAAIWFFLIKNNKSFNFISCKGVT